MTSDTLTSLQSLAGSEELSALESSLVRERADTLSDDLHRLEDSKDLMKLSEKLAIHPTPNVLEIMEEFDKLVRHDDERLHTRFLEFFLKPREERHGLSDAFLKALLKKARFWRAGQPNDLDLTQDFSDTDVIREKKESEQCFPDLRLRNGRQKVLILIENKIGAEESPRQLEKYWKAAEQLYPTFAIGGLFLTPDGRTPTQAGKYEYGYVAIRYGEIARLLNQCVEFKRDDDPGVILVRQYASAIGRWFVDDPAIQNLAWRIYMKHPAAVDYLAEKEHCPWMQINKHLQDLIKKSKSSLQDLENKPPKQGEGVEVWFVPREWDKIQRLRHACPKKEDVAEDRLLIFWFGCYPTSKTAEHHPYLALYLGTTPSAPSENIKKKLIGAIKEVLSSSQEIPVGDPREEWTIVWARTFLTAEQLHQGDRDFVLRQIDDRWQEFINEDLPKLNSVILPLFQ